MLLIPSTHRSPFHQIRRGSPLSGRIAVRRSTTFDCPTEGPRHLAHGHTGAVAAREVRDAREVVNAVRQRELLLHVGQLADPRIDSPLGAPSRPVVIRILVARKKFSSFSLS